MLQYNSSCYEGLCSVVNLKQRFKTYSKPVQPTTERGTGEESSDGGGMSERGVQTQVTNSVTQLKLKKKRQEKKALFPLVLKAEIVK